LPRQARRLSGTGVYHIMLRGNEKKDIFIDPEDKGKVIQLLHAKKIKAEYLIYAYCIMSNHMHLVVKEGNESISEAIKKVATAYAYYFNKKYRRVGHVFQDRFKSECIEDERYLLAAIRYVHQNPVKAGLCKAENYKWSSYKVYVKGANRYGALPETGEILSFFSNERQQAIAHFKEFIGQVEEREFLDIEDEQMDEENLHQFINRYLVEKGVKFDELSRVENKRIRNELIVEIVSQSNLSLRRISELTGFNRETVRRALKR